MARRSSNFWVTLGEHNIPLLGFIDLVAENFADENCTGDQEVIDHKVGGKAKTQDDIDNDMQLSIYSHATGVPRVRFRSFVKNKKPVIKTVSALRGIRAWKWAAHVVTEVANSISKGVFPPGSEGWHCTPKWCGYWDICRGKDQP